MSAPRIPVPVTKTLIAPTLTVLTVVLVNKDSQEMDQLVKVYYNTSLYTKVTGIFISQLMEYSFFLFDC